MSDEPPISFSRQLGALDVGASVAVAKRLERCDPETQDIAAVKNRMRQSINPRVSRARTKHGREFVADSGEFITTDGCVVVTIAITRTA